MSTVLKRLEFKQRYPAIRQGLFVLLSERRLPKGQEVINLGKLLSAALADVLPAERADTAVPLIAGAVERHSAMSLTHIEILFTPELHLDVIGTLLSLCRNRRICIVWPGTVAGAKLYYASPGNAEFYAIDTSLLQDTYIISE